MRALIQVRDLVKRYGNLTAVDHVSFEVYEGEVFSLLGPNGAGKTTTISVLSTLLPPTSGEVRIGDFLLTKQPMEVRKLIGVVPQEIALYQDLSGRENLMFWGRMYGIPTLVLKQRIEEVLAQVGLLEKAGARVRTYSGGMKRRLNLAVGLLHRPRLLFLDEPTVGIDPQSRRAILDLIKSFNREGMTIFYTTHYMEEAQEISHRVAIMDHGRIIAMGTLKELLSQGEEQETLILHFEEEVSLKRWQQHFAAFPGVLQAVAEDHRLTLITPSAESVLPTVMQFCVEQQIKVRTIEIKEPNLESVFLRLTGRALRD